MSGPPSLDALAELLGPPIDKDVLAGQANSVPLPVAGLPDGTFWTVNLPQVPHLPAMVVGRGLDDSLRLLGGRPQAFAAIVQELGATIEDAETAIGFVKGFLAATRPPEVLVQVPETADDIAWRPGTPDEEQRRVDFLETVVFEPEVVATDDGFQVSLVVVRDQHALRSTYQVRADGALEVDELVVATELPLPFLL